MIAEAAHEHISAGKATGAALLRQVSINAGFLVIMVIGFAILGIAGGLNAGWIALGIIAILIVGGMVAAMAFAAMKPDLLLKLLAPLVRVIDRFLTKREKKPVDAWVKDTVNTYAQSAALHDEEQARHRSRSGTQCCREHLRAWVLRLCCSCFSVCTISKR